MKTLNLLENSNAGHTGFFSGRLLVAMPSLTGSFFDRSVIFICHHDDMGAMGLVVNQPLSDVDFAEILRRNSSDDDDVEPEKFYLPVYFGGPVENERGFVLHSTDNNYETTKMVGNLGMTASVDILHDIINHQGPERYIFLLGYAGWGAGQLEDEYHQGSWLLLPYDSGVIFDSDNQHKWDKALQLIGIEPGSLSVFSGNA